MLSLARSQRFEVRQDQWEGWLQTIFSIVLAISILWLEVLGLTLRAGINSSPMVMSPAPRTFRNRLLHESYCNINAAAGYFAGFCATGSGGYPSTLRQRGPGGSRSRLPLTSGQRGAL